jgi:hypothetical protein
MGGWDESCDRACCYSFPILLSGISLGRQNNLEEERTESG